MLLSHSVSKHLWLTILGLIAALLGATSCQKGANPLEPPGAIQIQLSTEPVSIDPATAEDGVSLKIINNTMDGLMGYDSQGKLQNRLASKVTVAGDGKRYEFELRPGARWSDGQPVRAEDFVTGFRRSLAKGNASKLAVLLSPISRARDVMKGTLPPERLGVRAEGGKLVIELDQPVSYFTEMMTLPPAMPAREDALKGTQGKWTEAVPVTGAYRIAIHEYDRHYVMLPNEHHWDKTVESPAPVVVRIVHDESTAVSLFERAKLDILTRIPSYDLDRFRSKGILRTDPFISTYYLAFNVKKAPFSSREYRRALAGAIRRDEIMAALGSGERPASGWLPPGLEGHVPYRDTTPQFADAVKAVAARKAKGRLSVKTGFDTGARNSLILEKIQSDVMNQLGIRLELDQQTWKSYIKQLATDAPPLYRFGCMAPFLDPIFHLRVFTSGDPNNYTGWSNPAYDRLVSEIERLPRGAERERKIAQAQDILLNRETIVIPVYHYIQTHVVSPKIEGFAVNPFGVVEWRKLRRR